MPLNNNKNEKLINEMQNYFEAEKNNLDIKLSEEKEKFFKKLNEQEKYYVDKYEEIEETKNKKISEMGPATCIQYEEDGSVADVSCMSYYDTETRESVCACVRQGLTVNVKDPVLAELSKKRQFPPLMDSFCKFF